MKAPKTTEELLTTFRAEIRKTKSLTNKPFGMPVVVSYDFSTIDLMVDLLIEEQVPIALINGIEGYDYQPMMAKFKSAGTKNHFQTYNSNNRKRSLC